jgi:hypothetical protein
MAARAARMAARAGRLAARAGRLDAAARMAARPFLAATAAGLAIVGARPRPRLRPRRR